MLKEIITHPRLIHAQFTETAHADFHEVHEQTDSKPLNLVLLGWRSDIIDRYKQIYNLFRAFIFEKNVRLNIGFETGLN